MRCKWRRGCSRITRCESESENRPSYATDKYTRTNRKHSQTAPANQHQHLLMTRVGKSERMQAAPSHVANERVYHHALRQRDESRVAYARWWQMSRSAWHISADRAPVLWHDSISKDIFVIQSCQCVRERFFYLSLLTNINNIKILKLKIDYSAIFQDVTRSRNMRNELQLFKFMYKSSLIYFD